MTRLSHIAVGTSNPNIYIYISKLLAEYQCFKLKIIFVFEKLTKRRHPQKAQVALSPQSKFLIFFHKTHLINSSVMKLNGISIPVREQKTRSCIQGNCQSGKEPRYCFFHFLSSLIFWKLESNSSISIDTNLYLNYLSLYTFIIWYFKSWERFLWKTIEIEIEIGLGIKLMGMEKIKPNNMTLKRASYSFHIYTKLNKTKRCIKRTIRENWRKSLKILGITITYIFN